MLMSSVKSFIDILEELEKTTGTLDKIALITANKDNFQLKESLRLALDKNVTFGVAEFNVEYGLKEEVSDISAFNMLQALAQGLCDRKVTGQAAHDAIGRLFATLTQLQSKWIAKILKKDLASIGIGQRLYEQAYDEKGFKFRLMLAAPEDELENVEDGDGWLDLKANGIRTTIIVRDGKVEVIYGGRNGLPVDNFSFVKDDIEKLVEQLTTSYRSCVFDGEVHVNHSLENTMTLFGTDMNKTEDDFIGKSGKVSAAWKKQQEKMEKSNNFRIEAKFTIFDFLTLDEWDNQRCDNELAFRKGQLGAFDVVIKQLDLKKIEIIPSKYCANIDEGRTEAQRWIALDFEGGIWKRSKGLYEWRRSREWVKIKEVVDFEIQFKTFELQKDKYNPDGTKKPPMVGKVWGITSDGTSVKVGTGKALPEPVRIHMLHNWDTDYFDKIGTCSAQRPSEKGKYICARLDIIRLDRNSLD